MRNASRGLVALVGLFTLVLGLGFLIDPAKLGAKFFIAATSAQGLATMRADFPALFLTGAAFAFLGAWRGRAEPLLVPLTLLSVALAGRFVSLALDGASPDAFPPMIAEGLMVAILLLGRRALTLPR
jgi:hypothetical protein